MGYSYSTFSHNYLQMLYDHGISKETAKGLVFALISPAMVGGATSFVGYTVLMGVAKAMMRALGDDRDPEKLFYDTIRQAFGGGAEKAVRYGATGLAGADISGSLAIGMELPRTFTDLLGPFGGVAQDIGGAARYLGTGQPGRAAEKLLPTSIANIIRASRESLSGATTADGSRIWGEDGRPYFPPASETFKKVLGFKASDRATMESRTRESKRESAEFSDKRKSIYEQYRAYLASPKKNPDDLSEIMASVKEYNDRIKRYGMQKMMPYITKQSMHNQAMDMMRPQKREKERLKSYAQ